MKANFRDTIPTSSSVIIINPFPPLLMSAPKLSVSFDNLLCPPCIYLGRTLYFISLDGPTSHIMTTTHISLRHETDETQAGPSRFAVPTPDRSTTMQDLVHSLRRSKRIVVVCGELRRSLHIDHDSR